MKKYTPAILLIALSFATLPSLAQPGLGPAQLKAFEGYYRSSAVKELVVHFVVQHDTLVAKPQWRDLTFHLVPRSELVFHTLEPVESNPIDITFYRDPSGNIGAMSLGNEVRWNLEKDYKPVVRTEMTHTPEQLKPYAGIYHLQQDNSRLIQFSVIENNLVLKQMWDGNQIKFLPENPLDFYSKQTPLFSLRFTKDPDGRVTQVLAFGRDLWIKAPPPDPDAATLGAAAGKYRSKDDPDNQITITVRDKKLIVKQLWDGQEIPLLPLTDTYFYNDAQSYGLELGKNTDGRITRVVLLGTSVFDRTPQ